MRAGRMKTRITVEQVTETRAATGSVSRAWSTYAEPWAEIVPLRGAELYAAAAVQAETDVKFRIRRDLGITAKMRVVASGVVHDIRAVLNDPARPGETVLVCKAGINQG